MRCRRRAMRAVTGAILGVALGAWAAASGCGSRSQLGVPEARDASAEPAPEPPSSGFCAEATYDASRTQLSILVLLDSSGSMLDDDRWGAVTAALSAFVGDPATAGIGIGLRHFPSGSSGCDVEDYTVPTVPIDRLPDNALAITGKLAELDPYGGTPTWPAVRGAILYARAVALANPKEQVTIALVTDGAPNECASTGENVAAAEKAAREGDPEILTYVIGLATGYTDEIALMASEGGTGKPILVDDGAAAAQKIVDAMLSVKLAQDLCVFGIPIPPGTAPAPHDLSVRYRPSPGEAPIDLPLFADLAACDGEGFFPDDLAAPGHVRLCPSSCDEAHAAKDAQVTVTAGCGMGDAGGPLDAAADAPPAQCPANVTFSCWVDCETFKDAPAWELEAPVCTDGVWTCPPGTINTDTCDPPCPDYPHICCADGHAKEASCVGGAWVCPPGDIPYGQPGCTPPSVCAKDLPCPFGMFCDFPDDGCGFSLLGACAPDSLECAPGEPQVCACDGQVYPNRCAAAAKGADVGRETYCPAVPGTIECGGYLCDAATQLCRWSTDLSAQIPESYACLVLPPGCADGCECNLCDVCPLEGPCGTCWDAQYLVCKGVKQ